MCYVLAPPHKRVQNHVHIKNPSSSAIEVNEKLYNLRKITKIK